MNQEDKFLVEMFKAGADQPSQELTEKIMHRVDQSKVFEYQPVIGKKAWIGIGGIFVIASILLMIQSSGASIKIPEVLTLISDSFSGLGGRYSFELSLPKLPRISMPLMVSLAAFNVIGIYLMISYRWQNGMFGKR